MKRFSVKKIFTASLVIGALASVGLASPAQAAKSQCTSTGWICEWGGTNYSGIFAYIDPAAGSGGWDGSCRSINSYRPRSAYNRSIIILRYYSGSSCTGSSVTLASYASSSNFGFTAYSFRDLGI
ncbi:peptidase inhibitor family I36 protein [Micromonospora saelicesensis]|uniref:peptidase inhibitor family I36 protein n=1 Tax=Micromonospora saelicesensis TaxID=285676 RepID=UPI0015EBF447